MVQSLVTIKDQLPKVLELSGFTRNDSKISVNPARRIDLSPLKDISVAFRTMVKRELKKKKIKKQYLERGLQPPEQIEVELTSGDESSTDSTISEGGLPEKFVQFITDENVLSAIQNRRKTRRILKVKNQIDYAAIDSVL